MNIPIRDSIGVIVAGARALSLTASAVVGLDANAVLPALNELLDKIDSATEVFIIRFVSES